MEDNIKMYLEERMACVFNGSASRAYPVTAFGIRVVESSGPAITQVVDNNCMFPPLKKLKIKIH